MKDLKKENVNELCQQIEIDATVTNAPLMQGPWTIKGWASW